MKLPLQPTRHDSFSVYQIVQKFTPKQPRRKIRIRRPDGMPASPEEIIVMTRQYIERVWSTANVIQIPPIPPGVPFSFDELVTELSRIPITKSVAARCLPGVCWKGNAFAIATFLYPKLQQWWNSCPIVIPSQWKAAHLTFIHKPNKVPDRFEHLRPLALLEPIGKSVLGLITAKFADSVFPLICKWPQLAFLKGRSSLDAIRKVATHCAATRRLIQQQRRTVHQRAQHEPCYSICGGIQIFLDATQAFDTVPRQELFDFLATLPVDQNLVHILGAWHSETEYIFQAGTDFIKVGTGRGVRQGCRSAPLLWTCYTLNLFYKLSQKYGDTWVQECITTYADDIHSAEIFKSSQQLFTAIHRIGTLLDVLEEMGLKLSLEKTHVLLAISGTNCRVILRQLVKKGPNGPYIAIPRADGTFTNLPIKPTAKYLGVVVSYRIFEPMTIQSRLKAAAINFQRLKRWLCARTIPFKSRYQMWQACIFSTLIYGIFAVGFSVHDLLLLQQRIFLMFRQMLGNHSYITGQTHLQVLQSHNLPHPLALVAHAGKQLICTQGQRLNNMLAVDIVRDIDWTELPQLIQLTQMVWTEQLQAQQSQPATEACLPNFSCPFCSVQCTSLPNLRRHQTTVHGIVKLRTLMATTASFAVRGLPQCAHCLESFPNWRNFMIHIERNCCQVILDHTTTAGRLMTLNRQPTWPPLPESQLTHLQSKPYGLPVLQAIKNRDWNSLQQIPTALEDLTSYCVICGVYTGRPQELNQHLRTQHPELTPNTMCKASQLCRSQASNSPCRFCQRSFRRTHQCPVMTQAALILLHTDPTGSSHEQPGEATLRCDVCGLQCQDLRTLHDHVHQVHRLEPHDWVPLRDLLGSDPVCSHCLACFSDRSAVRQHVTLGQCPRFDPLRQPTDAPISHTWQEMVQQGALDELRKAPMQRLSLTLTCQFCKSAFQRQGDLSLHLQTNHAALWMTSQPLTQLLLAAYPNDCICNPATNARGLAHICVPYRQLGMIAMKLAIPLFLPWKIESSMLRPRITATDDQTFAHLMECCDTRNFQQLWSDPMLQQYLRSRCLQCGVQLHPAELRDHVIQAHPSAPIAFSALLPQILAAMHREATSDFQCDACTLIFSSPATGDETADMATARTRLAQIHLQHQCPVLHQICFLLTCTHGVGTAAHSGGFRDAGGLQTSRSSPDVTIRAARRRSRAEENEEGAGPTRKQGRRRFETSAGNGGPADSRGCRATGAQATRLLDLLHANRAPSPAALSDPESNRMASTEENGQHDSGRTALAAALSSDTAPGGLPDAQTPQVVPMQGERPIEDHSHRPWSTDTGGELSLSTMASGNTAAEDHITGAHHDGTHAQIWRTTPGHHEGPERHSQVSFSEAPGRRDGYPLADAGLNEARRAADAPDDSPWQHGLELGGYVSETSLTEPQPTCPTPHGIAGQGSREEQEQGQSQRSEGGQMTPSDHPDRIALLRGLASIMLANDENWCYVNAAFLTTMWSFLSSNQFALEHWGPRSSQLASILLSSDSDAIELAHFPCFQEVLNTWHGAGGQGDPVEFIAHMMRAFQFEGINLRWEKRVQVGQLINCLDESDRYAPLILQFDPAVLQGDKITLQQMLRDWSNQDGMMRALTNDSSIICVQIDRNVRSGDGRIAKCDIAVNFHWGIQLPFFLADDLQVDWRYYKVVAALSHLGTDEAGHCRALLKVQMQATIAQPYMFLLTDDWVKSTPIWREPDWFHRNTTCFWLCKHEHVSLYDLQPDQIPQILRPPDPPQPCLGATDLLQMFAAGTDEAVMDG